MRGISSRGPTGPTLSEGTANRRARRTALRKAGILKGALRKGGVLR